MASFQNDLVQPASEYQTILDSTATRDDGSGSDHDWWTPVK